MKRFLSTALGLICFATVARGSSVLSIDVAGTQSSKDHDYVAGLTNDGPEPKANWPNIDWIHFGDNGSNSLTATNAKAGGTGQISRTAIGLGGLTTINGRTDTFTSAIWSDGSPTANQPGTTTGIETGDAIPGQPNGNLNKGFSLTIGPLTQDRSYSLLFYGALRDSKAILTATLSDGTTQTLNRNLPNATFDVKYMVDFLPRSPAETLTLNFIDAGNGTSNLGSITLEAVSLAGNVAPEPASVLPVSFYAMCVVSRRSCVRRRRARLE